MRYAACHALPQCKFHSRGQRLFSGADTWAPHSATRLSLTGGLIERIVDYIHCPWVLPAASSIALRVMK